MLRAMPTLENGLPTSVFAYASMSCSDLFEHPSCTYEYCTETHRLVESMHTHLPACMRQVAQTCGFRPVRLVSST